MDLVAYVHYRGSEIVWQAIGAAAKALVTSCNIRKESKQLLDLASKDFETRGPVASRLLRDESTDGHLWQLANVRRLRF